MPKERTANNTTRYRHVRAEVLDRDNYRCRQCGTPALTVRHTPPVLSGLDPDTFEAVCHGCQLITPGDQSGEYSKRRRRDRTDRKRSRKAAA